MTGAGEFVNVWVFALPSLVAAFQVIFVVGQTKHAEEASAFAESVSGLTWGTLPFQEIAPLFQLTFRRFASNSSTGKADLRRVARLVGSKATLAVASGAGSPGAPGQGVPVGGTAGQVLTKIDSADFNTAWADSAGSANFDLIVVDIDDGTVVVDIDNGTVVAADS
jgi:hypothetical protein